HLRSETPRFPGWRPRRPPNRSPLPPRPQHRDGSKMLGPRVSWLQNIASSYDLPPRYFPFLSAKTVSSASMTLPCQGLAQERLPCRDSPHYSPQGTLRIRHAHPKKEH